MLPAHLMHARLESAGSVGSLRCELNYNRPAGYTTVSPGSASPGSGYTPPVVVPTPTIVHGVARQADGVVITGPGTLTVSAVSDHEGDLRSALMAAGPVQVYLSFGVAGVDRPIRLDGQLEYVPNEEGEARGSVEWQLNNPNEDPWCYASLRMRAPRYCGRAGTVDNSQGRPRSCATPPCAANAQSARASGSRLAPGSRRRARRPHGQALVIQ
jgi:hypothetical protein